MNLTYAVNNLSFDYDDNFSFALPSLEIPANSIFGITGLNGSGKTTLLKLLAFLLPPKSGEIKFFNHVVTSKQHQQLRNQITLLLQNPILLQRTIFANVAYGLQIRKAKNIKSKVAAALDYVGLPVDKFGDKYFNQLSGGELKRVALAARIALDPKVLLLDEPTTNIDKQTKQLIAAILLKLNRERNTTIVVSSHDEQWLDQLVTAKILL